MDLTELRYQPPETQTYLGSPSLTRLPGGDLLAVHDYFGRGCPRNHEDEEHLSSVYRSRDDGATWGNLTHVAGCFWSTLFTHGGAAYLLGASQQYGSIVIRRSTDGGCTWTHPADARSGLLFRGGPRRDPPNYHGAPVPVVVEGGRLYRAFEDCTPCRWPSGFRACVISAPADSDLLDASNWTMSNSLAFDRACLPAHWGAWADTGWLEGNIVVAPDGAMWNILRLNARAAGANVWALWDRAAMVRVEDQGRRLSFDPATGFIALPGGHSKFTIRRCEETRCYCTLSNGNLDPRRPTLRSVLSLYASDDLRRWRHCRILLEDDSGLAPEESFRLTGFQYVDWHFDGPDILYLVRTAYRGAHNFHDSNRITFHRLRDYRAALRHAGAAPPDSRKNSTSPPP